MKRIWNTLFVIFLVVTFLVTANFLGSLLMPLRLDYGSTWERYFQEEPHSADLLFFGSSMVYCDVIPASVYETSGITSYVMAGPEMTMPVTYYYVREAVKTQSPKMIAVELNALFYGAYTSFTKVTIGYMPWSWNRLAAIFTAAEEDARFGLLFPLYNYHSRWSTVTSSEILYHLSPTKDIYAGYTPLRSAVPQSEVTYRGYTAGTDSYENNLAYLRKIGEFCKQEGIDLLLYAAPSMARIPTDALEIMKADLGSVFHTAFLDFNDNTHSYGIENETDWFDSLHYNINGAEKFSRYFGTLLLEEGLMASSQNADSDLWADRVEAIRTYKKN